MAAFTTIAAIGGAALSAGSAIKGASDARKNEKRISAQAKTAANNSAAASAALAAAERESFVPGFSSVSDRIPGYHRPIGATRVLPSASNSAIKQSILNNRDRSLGRPIPLALTGKDLFSGDDVGIPSRTVVADRGNEMARGFNEQIMATGGTEGFYRPGEQKQPRVVQELVKRRFEEVTRSLPKSPSGLPIFPDPSTKEGKDFYSTLPKSIAEMANDPNMAQMYQGSNIVNPYANVRDLSGIVEDASDLLRDRSDLLKDRTDLIQDRTALLQSREGLFESAVPLGQDLSIGQEDLSRRIVDLRPGAQDFSGLATDTSVLASNAFADLQIATQAADLQAQQADQALANTLSTIRATGAGAGGATAIAQAALQSKLGIAATIEQQEARNTQLRAQGQQQIEQIRMSESKRLQDIALGERLRLEGLRQSEGLRIDEARLQEGRRLQELGISEGRRLQDLAISEQLRGQGLTLDESLRLQQAQYDAARERDRFAFDEAGRLQQAQYDEAGRLQTAKFGEALRVQQARLDEQQRLQQADAMAREYQFRVAETREQNRLNRLAGQETQAVQNAASLEAAKISATAQRKGAVAGAIGSIGAAALGLAGNLSGSAGKTSAVDKNITYNLNKVNIPSGSNINASLS